MAEEDADEDDPRWELIRQLIEYKKFKEAASHLRTREAMQEKLFPRFPAVPELVPAANLLIEEVGIFDLINAFQKILKRLESGKHQIDAYDIEGHPVRLCFTSELPPGMHPFTDANEQEGKDQ